MNFDIVSFIPRAVMQGIPLLYGSTGEILTEKSGNLNLGIPGIMYVGGICGVIGAFFYEQAVPAAEMNGLLAVGIPMLCSLLGSLLMGLLYCLLTVTLLSLVFTRPLVQRKIHTKAEPTNADRVLHHTAKVTETIDNENTTGAVYIDGKTWTARSEDGDVIARGSMVTIVRMEGVKLFVRKEREEP